MSTRVSAHAAILLANIIFGVNYAISKYLVPDFISPLAIAVLRMSTATLLFWMIAAFTTYEKIERKDRVKLLYCGLLGVLLNMFLFLKSIEYTSPVDSSIMMTLTPLLVLLLSAVVYKEKITQRKILGVVLGALGALMLIGIGGFFSRSGENRMLGNFLSLGSSLSYSAYLVFVKPMAGKYKPLTVMRWIFTFATLCMLPLGITALSHTHFEIFDAPAWGSLLFVLLGATCITYVCVAYGLRYVPSTTVSIYNYSQPLVAAMLAISLGQDSLSLTTLLCAVLIFSGVFLVTRETKQKN